MDSEADLLIRYEVMKQRYSKYQKELEFGIAKSSNLEAVTLNEVKEMQDVFAKVVKRDLEFYGAVWPRSLARIALEDTRPSLAQKGYLAVEASFVDSDFQKMYQRLMGSHILVYVDAVKNLVWD